MKRQQLSRATLPVLVAVTFVLLLSAFQLTAAPASSSSQATTGVGDITPVHACVGLRCNDSLDCGTYCFCNNPDDTVGTCYLDSVALQAAQ